MKHIDTFKLMARAIAPAEMGGGIDLGSVADLCTEVESLRASNAKLEAQCDDLIRQRTRREKALGYLPAEFTIDPDEGGEVEVSWKKGVPIWERILSAAQEYEDEHDDTCDLCKGTGIGQHGDPNTTSCPKCRGGQRRGDDD